MAKYIDLYVKPYNEANVPVPTLQRLDIEDFISSIDEAISTLKSNGRMATKISDSITNGDVMEIESILAKSAKIGLTHRLFVLQDLTTHSMILDF